MPLAEAQARFAEDGPDARARPARRPGARRSAASWRPRDSGPAAPPLRRRCATSWSASRVALSDGTLAKAGGKVIKNVAGYDLGQAVRRLVRDARADRRRSRCGCTRCPPDDRHASPARATTRTRSRAAPRRSPRARSRPTASTSRWERRRRRAARALRRRGAGRPGRGRAARCGAAGLEDSRRSRTTTRCGRAARRPARDGVRRARCPGRLTDLLERHAAPPSERGASVVGRAALGPVWLALDGRRPRGGRARARRAGAAAVRAARRARGAARDVDPWPGRRRRAGAHGAASRSASTRPASSARAPSWEESDGTLVDAPPGTRTARPSPT